MYCQSKRNTAGTKQLMPSFEMKHFRASFHLTIECSTLIFQCRKVSRD